MKNKYYVLVPAYNAADTIGQLIDRLTKLSDFFEKIVVVNDGSNDDTATIVNQFTEVLCFSHQKNKGKGEALQTGIDLILQQFENATAIIFIDSDLQHEPEHIPLFVEAFEQGRGDFIIGRRQMTLRKMPLARILSNLMTSFLISIKLRKKVYDSQCGFRMISTALLKGAKPFETGSYAFESELLIKSGRNDAKFAHINVPTIYHGEQSYINGFRDTFAFIRTYLRF
ncbi:MAG: glycosyltransferase family 2 protein [Calditrichaeota bacterium]|nr:MAG: glycosyltransferase family 2 protein [Calditrichota bacterium]